MHQLGGTEGASPISHVSSETDSNSSEICDSGIDRFGRFRRQELEHRYLRERAGEGLQTVRILLAIVGLLSAPFYRSDFLLFGAEPMFQVLAAARTADIVFSLGLAAWIGRLRNVERAHNALTAWLCCHLVFSLLVGWTRPPEYVSYLLIDVVTVGTAYFVIPIGTIRLIAICNAYSIAELASLAIRHREAGELVFIVAFVAFAGSNLVGSFGVSRLNAALRREFAATEQAEEHSVRLSEALASVRTLQGLLPTCAHCKKMRDEAGTWLSLERYVESHSNALVSHGICPDCLEKHYPHYPRG